MEDIDLPKPHIPTTSIIFDYDHNAASFTPTTYTPSRPTLNQPNPALLGPDGKLKLEEANRRRQNNLCAICGKDNHRARDCPLQSCLRTAELPVWEAPTRAEQVLPNAEESENP